VSGHQAPEATVLSFAMTTVMRPCTRTKAVMTPAAGEVRGGSPKVMPKLTKVLIGSTALPGSFRISMRSHVVSLPLACTRSTYSGPQPARTSARRAASVAWSASMRSTFSR